MPIFPDGTVISSSQLDVMEPEDLRVAGPMIGIVLNINPSDNEENYTAMELDRSDQRGWDSECKVLVVDDNSEPYLILENVLIPPNAHCGIDNFQEDLPKGLGKETLEGKIVPSDFTELDLNALDAEWCVVDFIGRELSRPYIQNWWYHPRNTYDPSTSGAEGTLTQADVAKNKSRVFRRVNGVEFTVNQNGDFYLSTADANSKIKVNPTPEKQEFSKGGSIQIDVKSSKQMEFNWNKHVPGLAAGSNSQSQSLDPSLPQLVQQTKTPGSRETSKTIIRFKELEGFLKTSNLNINCATEGSEKGQFVLLGEDTVSFMQGDSTVASFTMQEGTLKLIANDGTQVNVLDDEVQVVTKSGGFFSLKGKDAAFNTKMDVAGPLNVGGLSAQSMLLGDDTVKNLTTFLGAIATAGSTHAGAGTIPYVVNAAFITSFVAAAATLAPLLTTWLAKNMSSS